MRALGAGVSIINPAAGAMIITALPLLGLLGSVYKSVRQWQLGKQLKAEKEKEAERAQNAENQAAVVTNALEQTVKAVETHKKSASDSAGVSHLKQQLAAAQDDSTKLIVDGIRRRVA